MSNNANDEILDRAAEMIDYWEGTLHAELIRADLDSGDLDKVRYDTQMAEAEASRQEIYGADTYATYGNEEWQTKADDIRKGLREDGIDV